MMRSVAGVPVSSNGKKVVMSTVSVETRQATLRRPLYRRPEWDGGNVPAGSNTWGHGAVRTRIRRRSVGGSVYGVSRERSFDHGGTLSNIRRRAAMVVSSPGASVVSIAAMVVLLAIAPSVTAPDEDPVTPASSTTVTVQSDASLADVARDHVPDAPVGDAVARIASMNDVSGIGEGAGAGDGTASGSTRTLTVPVY